MLEFTEDLLIYLTEYLDIKNYINLLLVNSNIKKILCKNENRIWFNIINNTKNFDINKSKEYYNIHFIKSKDNIKNSVSKYCFTFPDRMNIKTSFIYFSKKIKL